MEARVICFCLLMTSPCVAIRIFFAWCPHGYTLDNESEAGLVIMSDLKEEESLSFEGAFACVCVPNMANTTAPPPPKIQKVRLQAKARLALPCHEVRLAPSL
jgi:hypothetical protein